ncbi:hypothetical protein [Bifidobacterium sp. ESL0745]|uniref:hypothetical protein n=1 Tax=Bifidobacterium sp. ESL0745 TaxID=2983226 RepID=UPI0023F71B65|nr:hypothetical protein [Bifidobacterium sp. ESL0745]MDF7664831.1 hypothetical protein [Bifidobacterium sp. ESL0745]
MIKVDAVYIGNGKESFIEDNFESGMNVIFSDDNDVGKTIVMQSIMYGLGAVPIFPKGFDFRHYFYIVKLDNNGTEIEILRDKNTFIVLKNQRILPFESVKAFQQFWNQNITQLPEIIKDSRPVQVGLELYTQIFFVAQDKRNSSRVNSSWFNKHDFVEMLYGIKKLNANSLDSKQISELKQQQASLKSEKSDLLKQVKVIREIGTPVSFISPTADANEQDELLQRLNALKKEIAGLRKERNHDLARKTKNETVLSELISLNRDISVGSVLCLNCGSKNVGYKPQNADYVFDITTASVRKQIIDSVQQKIEYYDDRINSINAQLRKSQDELENLLVDKEVTLADIVSTQDDYLSEREIDLKIGTINSELEDIKRKIETKKQVSDQTQKNRENFMDTLLSDMNYARKKFSDENEKEYNALFTTEDNVYSGSELPEFLTARVYALAKELHHNLPIVIDSFREGELSTGRENNLIDLLGELSNQIILTATVKKEEGTAKYSHDLRLHAINYSGHTKNKILTSKDNEEFKAEVKKFGIVFSEDSDITSLN